MTNKELSRLKRVDLLELLIAQGRENDRLTAELAEARAQLEERNIVLQNAGSIAAAALQLNGVFQAAQTAADHYLESVRAMEQGTIARCQAMEMETKQKCSQLLAEAQKKAADMIQKPQDA